MTALSRPGGSTTGTGNALFLWPHAARLHWRDWLPGAPASADIETLLEKSFPGTCPVLFSSARAALTAVLQAQGISRPDHVWCPSYSSHCVLEAIAHVGTPTPVLTPETKAALIYHQWGFAHRAAFGQQDLLLIEDAVDTLFLPGTSPFACGGRFALWSLPKVLATCGGGVVFCRESTDCTRLREIRAERPASLLQACMRLYTGGNRMASLYWNGAEAMQGELAAPMRKQAWRHLSQFERLVQERISFLRRWLPSLASRCIDTGRLPSNLPLATPARWQEVWTSRGHVTSGLRNFNVLKTCPEAQWTRVAPLPAHLGMRDEDMELILARLGSGAIDEHQVL